MARTPLDHGRAHLRRPLNAIFGAASHIAVLRALAQRPSGATGGELSLAAGVAHQATLDALGRLEEAGIVSRLPMGRGYMFRLLREHDLVRRGLLPLLEKEVEFGERLRAKLERAFRGLVVAGAIFGSAGRGEDLPGSDLDVCLIVAGRGWKEAVLQRAAALSDGLRKAYGVRLSPVVFTRAEFARGVRSRDLMRNILRDADPLVGEPLEAVARG